ncbi:MAG: gamma-glutamyl-gamma-aminobutyrate hydrolase family protein [Coriobacteriia bacterium]|nr:gamma-glutamyl-gamma-aminobutyrate hydrolase family protein [Coriobacteriia bacterium]
MIKKNFNIQNKLIFFTLLTFIIAAIITTTFIFTACSNKKNNSDVTIGIANVTNCSEFYLYAREAAESTGAKVVDLDQVMPSYYTYEQTPKSKTYSSPEVEKIFKENHYGSSNYYDLTTNEKDSRGGVDLNTAIEMGVYQSYPSNVSKVMEGIDAVIIPGGEDVSPGIMLQDSTGTSKESNFQAANDVSDLLLVDYCIDNDIPFLGICRGMQMFCISQGAGVIDDIKDFYGPDGEKENAAAKHRDPKTEGRWFVPHDVNLATKIGSNDSALHKIFGTDTINNVPSWHHQLIRSVDRTPLYASGTNNTNGKDFIEAVELPGRKFAIGVQFHAELPIYLTNHNDERAKDFMDVELSRKLFQAFVDSAK